MRAFEFLNENATAGATAAGGIATVANPQTKKGKQIGFFGQYEADGETEEVVLRRNDSPKKKKS